MQYNIWSYFVAILSTIMVIVHIVRIRLVIVKQEYPETRGYVSNKKTRLYIVFDSCVYTLFFVIFGMNEFCDLNSITTSFDKIIDYTYFITIILLIFNLFLASKYVKEYRLTSK